MSIKVRYIGLDVHKETIVIAIADAGLGEAKAWKSLPYVLRGNFFRRQHCRYRCHPRFVTVTIDLRNDPVDLR